MQHQIAKQIILQPVEALVPYARNSRTHSDEQVAQIAASISEFGFTNPVLVDDDGGIVAGHGRVMAARQIGMTAVPTINVGWLSEQQRRAYVIADNQLAMNAGWDESVLAQEVAWLQDHQFNTDLLGFNADYLDGLLAEEAATDVGLTDQDDAPSLQAEPVTRIGDVWVMGKHRLMCGDSRDAGSVASLMQGRQINLVITSPPYASQRTYDESSGFKPIHPDEYVDWFSALALIIQSHIASDGSYFLNIKEHCEDGQRSLYVKDLTLAHVRSWGWKFIDEFCWRNTKNGVPGVWPNRLKNAFEPIFHFAKDTKIKFNPLACGVQSDEVFSYSKSTESTKTGSGLLGEKGSEVGSGIARPSNVVSAAAAASGDHPAAFPVVLPEFFIKTFSDVGDICFEPFSGSATTLIAAEQQNRHCYAMELSPQYVDVGVRRWQAFTGKRAFLESTGEPFPDKTPAIAA